MDAVDDTAEYRFVFRIGDGLEMVGIASGQARHGLRRGIGTDDAKSYLIRLAVDGELTAEISLAHLLPGGAAIGREAELHAV